MSPELPGKEIDNSFEKLKISPTKVGSPTKENKNDLNNSLKSMI